MTPTDDHDPSRDEDLFAFDFAEAVNVVGRALWSLTDRKGVNPDPQWPTLKDDLLALTHSLRACDGAPVVLPLHPNGKSVTEGADDAALSGPQLLPL